MPPCYPAARFARSSAAAQPQIVVRWRCGQGSGDGRSVRRLGGRRGESSGSRLGGQWSKGSAAGRGGHGGEWHGRGRGQRAGVVRAVVVCERRVGGRRGGRGGGGRGGRRSPGRALQAEGG